MRESEPLFVISVASRLLQLHPQTLRKYEREGFVAPSRTQGNLRLYSSDDIDRLRQVKTLVEDRGVNLSGVQMALQMTERVRHMQAELRGKRRSDYDAVASAMDDLLEMMGAPAEPPEQPQQRPVRVEVKVQRRTSNL
jgi:MerR family transcriptional regulator/heat shock protein HspR